jgi:hypothetical protein
MLTVDLFQEFVNSLASSGLALIIIIEASNSFLLVVIMSMLSKSTSSL